MVWHVGTRREGEEGEPLNQALRKEQASPPIDGVTIRPQNKDMKELCECFSKKIGEVPKLKIASCGL